MKKSLLTLQRVLWALGRGLLVFGIGLGGLLGALWLDHTRATRLPVPTGPFAVGRTTQVWRDTLPAALAPLGTRRTLLAWLWYPTASHAAQPVAEYLPAPWRAALAQHSGVLLTNLLTRDLARVQTHSRQAPAVAPARRAYPVVLLRAGLAKLTTDYTSLAEDLASHGYVVVGFDVPYRTLVTVLPDGQVRTRAPQNDADRFRGPAQQQLATALVQAWSADLRFALDQLQHLNAADSGSPLQGCLDLRRVGVVGHSLGGATALQFGHDEARCRAVIDLDGAPLGPVVRDGLAQPSLFLLSDHRGEPAAETRVVEANIRAIYTRLPPAGRWEIVLPGASHFGFSDDGALLKSPLALRVLYVLGVVRLPGRRQLAVTAHYIHTFFDVYLKGTPSAALQPQPAYPEAVYMP